MKVDDLKKDKEHKNGTIALLKLDEDCAKEIKDWCDNHSVECFAPEKLHCTVLFSRKPVPDISIINGLDIKFSAKVTGWEKLGDALVMKIDSSKINKLHDILMNQGATHDYPEFISHISVCYNYEKDELPTIHPKLKIIFNKILVEPIDPKFAEKTKEED